MVAPLQHSIASNGCQVDVVERVAQVALVNFDVNINGVVKDERTLLVGDDNGQAAFHLVGYVLTSNMQEHAMLDLNTFQTTVLVQYGVCGLVLDLFKNGHNRGRSGAAEATTRCTKW